MTFKHAVALLFLITINISIFGCMKEYGLGNHSITPGIEIPLSRFNNEISEWFAHSPHSSPYGSSHTSPCSSPLSSSPAIAATAYNQMKKRNSLPSQKESYISLDEEFQELANIEIE